MTKKKRSTRGKKAAENEVDCVSMTSSGSLVSEATDTDAFEELMDRLYEEKSSIKSQALRGLVHMMSSYVLQEECAARETGLCLTFSRSVKRGRGDVPVLAARGFSLLVLTLGLDDCTSRVWDIIQKDLIPRTLSGKSIDVRTSALEAYALGCFVVEEDFFKIQSVMDSFCALWKNSNSILVTSAVRGWSLILSSFTSNMIASSRFDAELVCLRAMLESADGQLQEAAGMALALLYTFGFGCEEEGDISEEGSDTASVGTCMSQMDETRDRMKDLSEGKYAKRSKKGRASQKATFRNICSFIEEGGRIRETKIKLQYGDFLLLSTLEKHIQMDFLRSILSSGFHRHLHENPLMHLIFNFCPRNAMDSTRVSKQMDKRTYKSPSSLMNKLRTQTRDWERTEKQLYLQNSFL